MGLNSDKLRVLIISSEYPPFLIGGLGTHVYELSKGLQQKGVEVFVFAHNPNQDETLSDGSLTVHFISQQGADGTQGSLEQNINYDDIEKLNKILVERAKAHFSNQDRGVDIIHSHDWFGFNAARELRQFFQAPVISTVHLLHYPFAQWWGNKIDPYISQAESAACKGSDSVITVSEAMRRYIIELHGVEPGVVRTIHNGFEVDSTESLVGGQGLPSLGGQIARSGDKIVLYAGRIAPMKGLEYLLLSASQVIEEFENVTYLICGRDMDNSYSWKLVKLIESDPRLRKKVRLLGWQSRMKLREIYRYASLTVVPSCFEPFPYSALEFMAAKLPIVATDVGGLPEMLAGNCGGLLVPMVIEPDGRRHIDIRKLAEAQLLLLRNPELASSLADAGRRRATTEFRYETMIESTLDAYKCAMSQYRASMT
jgi:glycosyltransferase involved in cell wall biosynthesis